MVVDQLRDKDGENAAYKAGQGGDQEGDKKSRM